RAKSIPSRTSPLETVTMKPARPTPDDIVMPALSDSGTRRTTRAGAKGFTTYCPSGTPATRYFPSSSVIAVGSGDFVVDGPNGSRKMATSRAGFPPFVTRQLMTPVGADAAPEDTCACKLIVRISSARGMEPGNELRDILKPSFKARVSAQSYYLMLTSIGSGTGFDDCTSASNFSVSITKASTMFSPETLRIGTPSLKIMPTPRPKVMPSCESCASPGPLTAHPIIERCSG